MSRTRCLSDRSPRPLAGLIVTGLILMPSTPLLGQTVPSIAVGRVADGIRPEIDGRVDEDAWLAIEPYSDFIQQEPNEGRPASERTEVRFLFDRQNVYISVIAHDSQPDNLVVTQSRRDSDLNETDSVQILLDTFNDGQNAFVFGTNPFGIEYDGQVMGEGLTGGTSNRGGVGGSQRGQVSGFNANWDADFTVRARVTDRGWEAEFAIPLRTLRYNAGADAVWGINVMRNIRRKNEQVFLAPVPRGYSIHRVSAAGKLTGLDLPTRRDIKLIPFVAGSVNEDLTLAPDTVEREGDIGLDVKWGVTPNMTLDVTVNTDFAQVEADEEQVNLTRFPLFFPEKRPFFLENAQTFQMGQPQAIDLFFTRRIGLSPTGSPIQIIAGGRLSGKVGGYNIGLLNMQTDSAVSRTGEAIAPANNFSVLRVQREVGRSNFGAMFVSRLGVGDFAADADYNRAYGLDAALQTTSNGKLFLFMARTDSPEAQGGSDYAGRAFYSYANPLFSSSAGYAQVGETFNPEVGFLPRRAYRTVEGRFNLTYQPERWPWIRRISPHVSSNVYWNLDNDLESSRAHLHFFEIQPVRGGRFGYFINVEQDRPLEPFRIFSDVTGRTVVVPAGDYTWTQGTAEWFSDPSAPLATRLRHKIGTLYDGDYFGWEIEVSVRVGARFLSSIGWNRDDVESAYGDFTNDLLPVKASYSFTSLANIQALIQYNSQRSTVSSNIRLALLDRSGTGLFVVYNDRRDTSDFTSDELLGRSFIVKYTRLFDF